MTRRRTANRKTTSRQPTKPGEDPHRLRRHRQRIPRAAIPARNYNSLVAGKEGVFYLTERPLVVLEMVHRRSRCTDSTFPNGRWSKSGRHPEPLHLARRQSFSISKAELGDHERGRRRQAGRRLAQAGGREVYVDPPAEWRQNVPGDLAHRARLLLRSGYTAWISCRRETLHALSRGHRRSRRSPTTFSRRCWARSRWGTCSSVGETHRRAAR